MSPSISVSPSISKPKKIGFIIAGQSNSIGLNVVPYIQHPPINNRVFSWNKDSGEFEVASDPLLHLSGIHGAGFVREFSERLISDGLIGDEDEIYLFPCGYSGSGMIPEPTISLSSGTIFHSWTNDNDAFNLTKLTIDTIERGLQVVPDIEFGAILWHQGETDNYYCMHLNTAECYLAYQRNLRLVLGRITHSIGGDVPVIVGTVSNTRGTDPPINVYIRNATKNVVELNDLRILTPPYGDNIHYSALQQLEIGKRYFEVFETFL
jgi:hypothetical protein